MGRFAVITRAETVLSGEIGRHVFETTALLRVSRILYNLGVCTVEHIDAYIKVYNDKANPSPGPRKRSVNADSKAAVSLSYDSGY
jgi:hypothetical protein